jgi:hypothetical protein
MKMTGPSSVLKDSFENAITDFNKLSLASTSSYDDWKVYLHPNGRLLIEKVDDPGEYITGSPCQIIGYLDADQTNQRDGWPIFLWDGSPGTDNSNFNDKNAPVGHVTGAKGKYYDTLTDYGKDGSKNYYPVQYAFGFRQFKSVWYITQALLTPTGPKVT